MASSLLCPWHLEPSLGHEKPLKYICLMSELSPTDPIHSLSCPLRIHVFICTECKSFSIDKILVRKSLWGSTVT